MSSRSSTPFGALLRRYRLSALLTQEQLAARARLSPDTIRALESGKRRSPRPDSLLMLIEALTLADDERAALLAAARAARTAPLDAKAVADVATPRALVTRDPVPPSGVRASVTLGAAQPSPLVGRTSELRTIRERLAHDGARDGAHARLLTLTGPAGVGKTRLALAAAALLAGAYRDGVTLVDLAPLRDPAQVLPTVARAVGLADTGNRPLAERLRDYLRERSLLLILDNFEHVLPAAGAFADLLANCPKLTLLVTSRIPLRLRWEWTLRVEPLPTPDLTAAAPPIETLLMIPAVALFVERAQARQADFALNDAQAPLVARLTAELDGLPLAIELAAARLDTLALPVLARRLGDRLRLLHWDAPDIPTRQRSLEAAVGWSYDLLSAHDQRLFRSLGVFVGQVSLPAITAVFSAVAGADPSGSGRSGGDASSVLEGLASLAEASLAPPIGHNAASMQAAASDQDADDDIAFHMLETVREYAWERLDAAGELETAQRAHARYFQTYAEQTGAYLRGPAQRIWFLRLEREHDNLRAALRWLLTTDNADADATRSDASATNREDALRLASALAYFWWTRGYLVEGWQWLEESLRQAPQGEPAVRLRALVGAGAMLSYHGRFDTAANVLDEAMALAHAQGRPAELAQAFTFAGLRAVYSGDAAYGIPLLREALRLGRTLADHHLVGFTLMYLGGAAFAQGHLEEAAALFAESLARFELAGDGRFAGNMHVHLAWLAAGHGDVLEATRRMRLGLEAAVAFEERRLLSVVAQVALTLPLSRDGAAVSDPIRRAQLLGAVDTLSEATGMTLLQTLLKSHMDVVRQRLRDDQERAAYQAGRLLSFGAVAALVAAILDDVSEDEQMSMAADAAENAEDTTLRAVRLPDAHDQVASQARRSDALSARQREVLRLVAQGLSNKAIGQRLFLSPSTVTYHLSAAFNKLGADTRAQAVAVAAQRGLL